MHQFLRSVRHVCVVIVVLSAGAVDAGAQSLDINKLQSQGAGDGAGAGDLRLTERCELIIEGNGFIEGSLSIQVAGQPEAQQWFVEQIQDQGSVTISTTVPASNSNRNVDCWASTSWGFASHPTWTLPGSGPGTALFKIAAFIRQNWVGQPIPYRVFGGDDRNFSASDGASHRIQASMDMWNPATNNGTIVWGPNYTAGQTLEYDRATSLTGPVPGVLTAAAKADWTWNNSLKTRWDTAIVNNGDNFMNCSVQRLGPNPSGQTSGSRVSCESGVKIPLTPQDFTPRIRWDFDVDLQWGKNKINYFASGCHTYFPNFELYVWGKTVHTSTDSGNYTDLYYNCAETFNKQGDLQ